MNIINIGSLNLDFVYRVDHIVRPGETESGSGLRTFPGGKGLNQSVALARAGAEVYHGGLIGEDGQLLLEACRQHGVRTDYIREVDGRSGHAIIQLDRQAQNSILLYGGANQRLTKGYVDETLSHFKAGDMLLLQNEVNLLPCLVDEAFKRGLCIALNPSPFDEKLEAVDLGKVRWFLLNEVEGEQLTGLAEPEAMLAELERRFPTAGIVLTLGEEGALYAGEGKRCRQAAFPARAVDTTAAGDTFTGYFLASLAESLPVEAALRRGAMASAIAVGREGAVPSIPARAEVEARLKETER